MKLLIIFLVIAILLSGGVILSLFFKHFSQLKAVDPKSLPALKEKQLKDSIFEERVRRLVRGWFRKIGPILLLPWRAAQLTVRQTAIKLKKVEREYSAGRHLASTPMAAKASIDSLMASAKEAFNKGDYKEAEAIFIEVISFDPKALKAYEYLGRIYTALKEYANARESLSIVIKAAPKDASALCAMSELEESQGDLKRAFALAGEAKAVRPRNPKYLDRFIELAIANKQKAKAKEGVADLRDVNPDNQKIQEFEARIAEMEE